ncbi:MAG: NTP transferase domain-containing protein [Oscillospiraceae bacterium]|nr:NTP transferase domain-containing protein [Oscillospiraceae bacterium]
MNTLQHAVIAAAGFGSRLNRGIPKCLVEVNGHKIIEYQLALLRDVPDVRIVVGYHADDVIRAAGALRPDITFIVNRHFDTTSTLQSYYMGCSDIHDFFLLLDGDIIPQRASFQKFLSHFSGENMIGLAPSTTEDAVFIHRDSLGCVAAFTREEPSPFEWSNIALLHSDSFEDENIYVYQCIEKFLPVRGEVVERLEIDTPADLQYALEAMRNAPGEYLL